MPYYKKNYKKNYGYLNKKKWAPFMYDITPTNFNLAPEVIDGSFVSLVTNSVETSVPTPTILKVKHLKVAFDARFDSTALSSGFICIMFVPQGITPGVALATQHPEWVMAWKNIRNDITANHHETMLTTRLTRNLNSGDKIICYFSFLNRSQGPIVVQVAGKFSGVVRNN